MKFKIIVILSVFLLTSCASKTYFTTLDILKPAVVTFPPEVKNVVIVNNSTPQPYNEGHTLKSLFGTTSKLEIPFDSAGIFITASFRDDLENYNFFDKVTLSLTNQNLTNDYESIHKLSPERIKTLCIMFDSDAIISLDKVYITDHNEEFYTEYGSYGNETEVKVKTDWTLYYLDMKAHSIQFVDSFYWSSYDFDRKTASLNLPNRYNALVDASILLGSNTAERMVPRWEKEDRYFFAPKDSKMQQAMDSVPYLKWQQAITLWEKAAETSKSNKIKYQAYNNIAVSYEIIGNFEKANIYADKALETYLHTANTSEKDGYTLVNYVQSISKRQDELKLLNKQLGKE